MIRVLSTKRLTDLQRQMLPQSRYALEEYDALSVTLYPVTPDWGADDLLVFTSRNAVNAVFPEGRPHPKFQTCCVGRKTARALEEAGQEVKAVFHDAQALTTCILEKNPDQNIVFLSGNRRLDTVPEALGKSGKAFREQEVYATELNPVKFEQSFDAVLFYSPSGVQAFTEKNEMGSALAVCIGPTTAAEASKYTDRVKIAPTPEVEAVLKSLLTETLTQE